MCFVQWHLNSVIKKTSVLRLVRLPEDGLLQTRIPGSSRKETGTKRDKAKKEK